jgi:hypothetical protein
MNTKILVLAFLATITFGQTLLYCDPMGSIDDSALPAAKKQTGTQDENHPGMHQRESDGKWIKN